MKNFRVVLLLLFVVREWQVADADCRDKLCASSKGIKFMDCPSQKDNGRKDKPTGNRDYKEFDCPEVRNPIEFKGKKFEWFDANEDVEYITITKMIIPKDATVTIGPLNDSENECKQLELKSEANYREKIILKLRCPKRQFKITSTDKTAVIKFICNKDRRCAKPKEEAGRMKRIVRGGPADMDEFPFMANLYVYYSTHQSENNYAKCNEYGYISDADTQKNCCDGKPMFPSVCGGSIVTDKWILTAAHCVVPVKERTIDNVKTKIYLVGVRAVVGDYKRTVKEPSQSQHWTTPPNVIPKDEYNKKTRDSDIALLRLSQIIPPNADFCCPLCLAPSNMDGLTGCKVQAAGWGRKDDNKTSNVLRKGTFEIHDKCGGKITDNMICYKNDLTNTCKGDSGGPVFCQSANDFYYQVGVIGFGERPDEKNKADLWKKGGLHGAAKVVNFLKWINENVENLP